MKLTNTKKLTNTNTDNKKNYFEISGQVIAVQQECSTITDEQIQEMVTDFSYYGYVESYS
jgi:hypothetical protein